MPHPSESEAPLPPSVPLADPVGVCTLDADGMQERLAWIHREILPHHVGTERLKDGLALEVASAPGLRERLDHLIALERECCAPLVFERMPGASPDRLRLEIRGIDPDAPVFASLRRPSSRRPTGWPRLAYAGGVGAGVSLLVCCVLPLAVAGLLGAAPWLALESPGALAAVWLLGTGAAWWWLSRRRRSAQLTRPDPGSRCGC